MRTEIKIIAASGETAWTSNIDTVKDAIAMHAIPLDNFTGLLLLGSIPRLYPTGLARRNRSIFPPPRHHGYDCRA